MEEVMRGVWMRMARVGESLALRQKKKLNTSLLPSTCTIMWAGKQSTLTDDDHMICLEVFQVSHADVIEEASSPKVDHLIFW